MAFCSNGRRDLTALLAVAAIFLEVALCPVLHGAEHRHDGGHIAVAADQGTGAGNVPCGCPEGAPDCDHCAMHRAWTPKAERPTKSADGLAELSPPAPSGIAAASHAPAPTLFAPHHRTPPRSRVTRTIVLLL